MKADVAPPAEAALALIERSITHLAAASLELARSQPWNDLLGTIDRLAALLGTDPGPPPEPVPADVEPAQIGRLAADWVRSLLLPEYLEESTPGRARYRVRLPEDARADGLGDLADFLDSLALRLELLVEGDTTRLSMEVGGAGRPAVVAACGADRLDFDLDLGATRGALRHMVALAGRVPAVRPATRELELEELSGRLCFSYAATGGGRLRVACALREPLRMVGRNDEGPVQIEVGAGELLAIDGEAGGTLQARVGVGAVAVRLPSSTLDADNEGTAEYHLAGVGGELVANRGDRVLKLRRLTLGGRPAVEWHDGRLVTSVDLSSGPASVELQPEGAGRFVLVLASEVSLRLVAAGHELTISAPAGTRLQMVPGRLQVQEGGLVVGAKGAAPLEVGAGRALVRRKEPREGEPHPALRLYETKASAS